MNTGAFSFFHGTSGSAAKSVLTGGVGEPICFWQARELVRAIWPIILEKAGSFLQTTTLFQSAGSAYATSAPAGLQNVYDNYESSTFAYGSFYATLSVEKAQGYATRSNSGSELLLFVGEALRVIDTINPDLKERLLDPHPELGRQLKAPPHPVILELSNIEASRLTRENGDSIDRGLIALVESTFGVAKQLSFRILNISPSDIVGVYDLTEVAIRPGAQSEPADLRAYRTAPADWLSSFTGPGQ